jgi:hypothetical protein
MVRLPLLCLLLALGTLAPGAPLAVTLVVRQGLPPYEDDNRLYRLEGEGCETLRPGQVVLLNRPRERRSLGQLEVVSVGSGFALARIRKAGSTYPMKGDLAIPRQPLHALPPLPVPEPLPARSWAPAEPALAVPPRGAEHREAIFFLADEATLTPGAKAKLKAWVAAWGRGGHWLLALPPAAVPPLADARVAALRAELGRLGVAAVDVGTTDQEAPGRFPAIFVVLDPG